jgi:16S rRNA G966 N2-methylase RsmD
MQAGLKPATGPGAEKTPETNTPGTKFDLVFIDPPYDAAEEYAITLGLLGNSAVGLLAEGALVIAEHRRKQRLDDRYGSLAHTRLLEQGDAALSFYAVDSIPDLESNKVVNSPALQKKMIKE